MSKQETPMTEALINRMHKQVVDSGKGHFDPESLLILIGALTEHAEALERMCAELAESVGEFKCARILCGHPVCKALTRYTTMKGVDELPQIHEKDGKWYFWDETWVDRIGPFDSQEEAEQKLKAYVEWLSKPDSVYHGEDWNQ